MLLSEEFSKVWCEFEAPDEGRRDEVQCLGSLAGSLTCACWVEVRKIESSNDGSEGWVVCDVREEFAEDPRVGNGDLAVQSSQSRRMNTT